MYKYINTPGSVIEMVASVLAPSMAPEGFESVAKNLSVSSFILSPPVLIGKGTRVCPGWKVTVVLVRE